jgi:AcrR family transcriptional regulator
MTATDSPDAARRPSARDRLLAAANELFYAEGIQTVGVDRIIEHAGVAKASLYNLFGSKEQLEAAYLASRHEVTATRLTEAIAKVEDPRQKLLSIFDSQVQQFAQPDFRGCAFAAAGSEAPPGGMVEQAIGEFRSWMRALFTDLAEAAGAPDPEGLSRQLQLLYDGLGLAARMDHRDPQMARSGRDAAQMLLDAALS